MNLWEASQVRYRATVTGPAWSSPASLTWRWRDQVFFVADLHRNTRRHHLLALTLQFRTSRLDLLDTRAEYNQLASLS